MRATCLPVDLIASAKKKNNNNNKISLFYFFILISFSQVLTCDCNQHKVYIYPITWDTVTTCESHLI
jgi:hypothetical protein